MRWTVRGSIPGLQTVSGVPPPTLLYRGSFPRVKRPGREADHSSPSIVDGENEWSYTSSSPVFTTARIQLAFSLAFAVPLCQMDTDRTKNIFRIGFPKVNDYHHNTVTSLLGSYLSPRLLLLRYVFPPAQGVSFLLICK